jgi:hypothetical protein
MAARSPPNSPAIQRVQNLLTHRLATRVQVSHSEKKGQIQIEYYGTDDLNRILTILLGALRKKKTRASCAKTDLFSSFSAIDSDHFPDGADKVRKCRSGSSSSCDSIYFLHLGCLGAIWTGWSWAAVATAVFLISPACSP